MPTYHAKLILLDIEGTTSSIAFVHEVMFPDARKHLRSWLASGADTEPAREALDQVARDAGHASLEGWAKQAGGQDVSELVAGELERLMDADAKATGLKQVQGLIWREGFESGRMRSHVYDDVPPTLRKWNDQGLEVCIYSSGSVQAQKLFFKHTMAGNLLPLISGHYDTRTGAKREVESYRAIAEDLQLRPIQVVFVSDVIAELDAAAAAGMQTALSIRPGNAPTPDDTQHPRITSFNQIEILPIDR